MRLRIAASIRIALLLLLAPLAAHAQDANNGAQVVVQSNSQLSQQLVPDGLGGAIVVWSDSRNGANDIYAQRVDAAGGPLWNTTGVPVCTAPQGQENVRAVADGSGGVIVTWQDFRTSAWDIYAQRLNASGQTQWTFNGVPLCQSSGQQDSPELISDGSGGAIVTWEDVRSGEWDVYAQRVGSNGATQWTVNGVNLTTQGSYQQFPGIVRDGAGGCIVAWQDSRNGSWDLYAQRLNSSGVSQWQFNGIEVSAAPGEQRAHRMLEDGAGGVFLAWEDLRNGPTHIYAQRLNAGGVALWTINGAAVLTSSSGGKTPRVCSDGAAGAIVTWEDVRNGASNWDIYAQRMPSGGIPAWTGNGIAVCSISGNQAIPQIVASGSGGAVIAWHDDRGASQDIYVQRIDGLGSLQWSLDGEPLCVASGQQTQPAVVADGANGAIIVWADARYATAWDLFAQRISVSKALLYPDAEHPALVSVRDTPNDQGGRVKLSWRGSNRDLAPIADVTEYRIWRSVPPNAAPVTVGSMSARAAAPSELAANLQPGSIVPLEGSAGIDYWEYLATQPAGRLTGYSYVAATTSDSIPGSNPRTAFMIEARTLNGVSWWFSNVDSGYSVDNLPPFIVYALTGTYAPGTGLAMHWRANPDADLAHYVIHRGATPDFVPGPGNLLGTTADTAFVDPTGSFNYYKVAAVDIHSNRGPFATLASQDVPVGTLLGRFEAESDGAAIRITVVVSATAEHLALRILRAGSNDLGGAKEMTPASSSLDGESRTFVDAAVEAGQTYWYWVELRDESGVVALTGPVVATVSGASVSFVRPAFPNPMRSSTVFAYGLGADLAPTGSARVSLRIFDARGRALRTVVDEVRGVGEHEVAWNGADDRGVTLTNGLYFWQWQAGSSVRRGSVVLMR